MRYNQKGSARFTNRAQVTQLSQIYLSEGEIICHR